MDSMMLHIWAELILQWPETCVYQFVYNECKQINFAACQIVLMDYCFWSHNKLIVLDRTQVPQSRKAYENRKYNHFKQKKIDKQMCFVLRCSTLISMKYSSSYLSSYFSIYNITYFFLSIALQNKPFRNKYISTEGYC